MIPCSLWMGIFFWIQVRAEAIRQEKGVSSVFEIKEEENIKGRKSAKKKIRWSDTLRSPHQWQEVLFFLIIVNCLFNDSDQLVCNSIAGAVMPASHLFRVLYLSFDSIIFWLSMRIVSASIFGFETTWCLRWREGWSWFGLQSVERLFSCVCTYRC